jgi:DNA polymerase-3 subunit epsilon
MAFDAATRAASALQRWRGLLRRQAPFPLDRRRWIVLDVEASGLDMRRDRLLSIAALALETAAPHRAPTLQLADSFEVVLRQPGAPPGAKGAGRADILVHGIGLQAQAQGTDVRLALEAFERYVGQSPLLAFHSKFDQTLVDRHMKQALGRSLRNPWIDLEHVAAVLNKQPRRLALDEWIKRLGLACETRHQAAADALVTAELLQKLWPLLAARGLDSWDGIARVAGEALFMPGRR